MKLIALTKGFFAQVNDEDFEYLNNIKWRIFEDKNNSYAIKTQWNKEKKKYETHRMHRVIMGLKFGEKMVIDHKDGDGLNNQRSNLRVCTSSQNSMNRKSHKNSSSNFKGVTWDKKNSKWMAAIRANGRSITVGRFTSEIEAAKAYNMIALKNFKEFSKLNLICQTNSK